MSRGRTAIGVWVLLVAACAFVVSRTTFTTDLSAFLPRSPTPAQQVLVDQLRELLVELNRTQGGSFVVIEHNMDFVMKLCPHVVCMVEGKVLAEGSPASVQANREVLEAYLGN